MEKKFGICAFGEILIDFTAVGIGDNGQKIFEQNPGGAPANVLVCAHKLGSKTSFLGKAGSDMHGKFLVDTLQNEGVDTTGFLLDQNYFTTLAFVDLDQKGERTFSFARKPGADTQMTKEELLVEHIKKSKIFHIGSLSLTHEPSRSATYYGIEVARKEGVIVSYDPNYRGSLWNNEELASQEMQSIIPDIMKISDEETVLLTGEMGFEKAAEILIQRGVKVVVVTLGSEGAYVRNKMDGRVVAGFSSEVVDTTGAGDAFWGGFLHKIAESECIVEALTLDELCEYVKFANAVASLCVQGSGAIPAMPKREEVLKVLNG